MLSRNAMRMVNLRRKNNYGRKQHEQFSSSEELGLILENIPVKMCLKRVEKELERVQTYVNRINIAAIAAGMMEEH